MKAKSYVIALEEHYQDAELRQHTGGSIAERLEDVDTLRLREMDEAGIDLQVLSHANPGLQGVDAATGVPPGAPHQRPAARSGAAPSRPPCCLRCGADG